MRINHSNEKINRYRKGIALRMMFSSLSDTALERIRIKSSTEHAYLSKDYLLTHSIDKLKKASRIFMVVYGALIILFVPSFLTTKDVIVQLGLLSIAIAVILISFELGYRYCQSTIEDKDIIIKNIQNNRRTS